MEKERAMTLSFSTTWPKHMGGGPTHFVEKIWEGLEITENEYDTWLGEDGIINREMGGNFNLGYPNEWRPKIHTIREDKHDRWRAGMKIHMAIGNRTPNRFQFAPTLVCMGVQEIVITEKIMTVYDCIKLNDGRVFTIQVDGKHLPMHRITDLAINDGFDSVDQFFQWFNEDFEGKLIGWTDFKY